MFIISAILHKCSYFCLSPFTGSLMDSCSCKVISNLMESEK